VDAISQAVIIVAHTGGVSARAEPAPTPQAAGASCTITHRPVFATDFVTVGQSIGTMESRSITSQSIFSSLRSPGSLQRTPCHLVGGRP
jgi:hypothetical protein